LFVSKTPHVAFLYPGQARIVFLFGARSLKTWSFGLETRGEFFSVLDTWKPASLTRLLPEGNRYLLMIGACMFIRASPNLEQRGSSKREDCYFTAVHFGFVL
jgi:hypothetical protein